MPLMFGAPLREMTGRIRRLRSSSRLGVGVVALVAEQGVRASAGTAGAARDGRDAVDQGEGLGDVVDVGRGRDDLERGAASVADQVVFAARLPPVDRRRTGVGAPFFARMWEPSTHARGPVEFAGRVQFGEQDAVQLVEDPGLLPPLQTSPAGLPGAEPQLQRQELPGYVVVEDVQDALQTQPVRHRPRPRRLLRPGRQQRLDQRPQVVVHDPRPSTHTITNGRIVTPVTPDQDISTRSCYELLGHLFVGGISL